LPEPDPVVPWLPELDAVPSALAVVPVAVPVPVPASAPLPPDPHATQARISHSVHPRRRSLDPSIVAIPTIVARRAPSEDRPPWPLRVLHAGAYQRAPKQRYHDPRREFTAMEPLSFGARLWLAIILPFRVLFDAMLAARVAAVVHGRALAPLPSSVETKPETKPELAPKVVEAEAEPERTALQLLAILQREGRFVDFLQEDVSSFSDADIGAAARVVHEGCKRGLRDVLTLVPVRSDAEGAKVELPVGYDANRTRVTGNVTGEPPFSGTLAHHGWRVEKIRLPELTAGHDPTIIAPAEVEL
jgi:hypothetical protein